MNKNTEARSKWYVITGSPSSGKTTVIEALQQKGYAVVREAARVLIDREIAKGKTIQEVRKDTMAFQNNILMINVEAQQKLPKDKLIFFDRGIPDNIVYRQLAGLDISKVLRFCRPLQYRRIFLMDPLPHIQDYARVASPEDALKTHALLKEVYQNLGYEIVSVPVMSIEERVKFIEERLEGLPIETA